MIFDLSPYFYVSAMRYSDRDILQKTNHRAGLVKVSDLARHWVVCRDTAAKIIEKAGLAPKATDPLRYCWQEIWRLEGCAFVPEHMMSAFKAPLLTVAEVAAEGVYGRSPRTIRRLAENGKLPVARLGIEDWRFRRCEVATVFPDLAE